jgi:hypothetical protein
VRHRVYLAALTIILLCFGLGILSTLMSQDDDTTPTPTSTTQLNEDARWTFLIIGVDRFDKPNPMLMSIWLAIHRIPEEEVVLLGIPLDYEVNVAEKSTLRDIFSFTFTGEVSKHFMDELESVLPHGKPDEMAVMDEIFFAELVDYVGGIPSGSEFLDGQGAVAAQRLIIGEPDALQLMQKRMLENLRFQLPWLDLTVPITSLTDLIPEHCVVTIDPAQLIYMASPLLPIQPETIRIELMPTSVESSTPTGTINDKPED